MFWCCNRHCSAWLRRSMASPRSLGLHLGVLPSFYQHQLIFSIVHLLYYNLCFDTVYYYLDIHNSVSIHYWILLVPLNPQLIHLPLWLSKKLSNKSMAPIKLFNLHLGSREKSTSLWLETKLELELLTFNSISLWLLPLLLWIHVASAKSMETVWAF